MVYQMLVPWLLMVPLSATPVATPPNVPAAATQSTDRGAPSVRISGKIEQVQPLPAPQDGMLEVFIRDPAKGLLVAIVPQAWGEHLIVNQTVDFSARPDGTQSYRDQSGQSRTVLRVKAAEAPTATSTGVGDLSMMLGILIVLMVGFGVLSVLVARSRASSRPIIDFDDDGEALDDLADVDALPADPADALSELARRSASSSQ